MVQFFTLYMEEMFLVYVLIQFYNAKTGIFYMSNEKKENISEKHGKEGNMNLEERQKLFENPTNEYRGKPFWAWNGELKEKELLRQIDIIKEMGFGGFFMHSRTGLETEYLGEKWFELINKCAAYGKEKQLQAWIYDEDRWPSGSAGGLVTEKVEYRAMYIEMNEIAPDAWESYEKDVQNLGLFACRIKDARLISKREIEPGSELYLGEKLIEFRTRYSSCNDNYNGYCYLNTMDERAVKQFIEVTYEKYLSECGNRFGNEIKGVFTDEPHRGGMFTNFAEGEINATPYTPGMEEKFFGRFGYHLKENLPELFFRQSEDGMSKVTRDYFELCQELFLEAFAEPVYNWCRSNNLIFTGHALHEDSLCSQALMQGSLMRFYEYMDYPGIDILSENNKCYWAAKQVQSVARQLGKKWVLSELYGCTGWQMNFKSYKNVGDWQALFGINFRCPHLSWYTMKGEAKRDYPASILHQSAWYRDYSYIENYFSRIHAAFDGSTPDVGLLVLNPIESVWARAYSGAFNVFAPLDADIMRLEEQYTYIFHSLASHQIDFDYGEEDIILRYGKVKNGCLYIGKCRYHKVLVAGLDTMRSSTLNLLIKFSAQGGEIIFAGKVPDYLDVCLSEKIKELADQCIRIPLESDIIADACKEKRGIRIFSEGREHIYVRSEIIDDGYMVMVLNTDREKGYKDVKICFGQDGYLEMWNPRNGRVTVPKYDGGNGEIVVITDLEPGEERLYVITNFMRDIKKELPQKKGKKEIQNKKLHNFFDYSLSEKNICVLDMVMVKDESGKTYPYQEVLKADRELRKAWNYPYRGGEMLQPWFQKKYRNKDRLNTYDVLLYYRFNVETIPKDIELVVEGLENIKSIKINNVEIERDSKDKWIDICFDKIEFSSELLHEGNNEILFEVEYADGFGIEAIYLIGSFGVKIKEGMVTISELPRQLVIGDITDQGLPFYSGSIRYKMDGMIEKDEKVQVTAKGFGGALMKLHGNSKEEVIAFPPYQAVIEGLEEIEIVFNRRNTFGPLHELPEKRDVCGPMSFVTEGNKWTDRYILQRQGLLERPEILSI